MLRIGVSHHSLDERFERGTELKWWTLGYLPRGRILVQTQHGQHYRVGPTVSLTPPHTPYAIQWGGGAERWMDMFAIFEPLSEWSPLLSWPIIDSGIGLLQLEDTFIHEEITRNLNFGLHVQGLAHPQQQALALNALERVLLLLDGINPLRGCQQRDSRIAEALAYISGHYPQALDVPFLARRVCLSPSHFAHLFRAQLGVAPMQYVEFYRLERAAGLLLTTNDSIQQVAQKTGFENALHFSTRFRRRFGQSPSVYRKTGGDG